MSFSDDLNKIIKKTRANRDLVIRRGAAQVFRSVILGTPVDTGTARGNWQASIGEYSTGFDEAKTDRDGGQAVAAAIGVLSSARGGDVVYLVNNLPYILPLEYGYSDQAPAGMVRLSVEQFERFIAEEARALG